MQSSRVSSRGDAWCFAFLGTTLLLSRGNGPPAGNRGQLAGLAVDQLRTLVA